MRPFIFVGQPQILETKAHQYKYSVINISNLSILNFKSIKVLKLKSFSEIKPAFAVRTNNVQMFFDNYDDGLDIIGLESTGMELVSS